MKKSELKKIIREELLKEESNRFGELEPDKKGNYKFYKNPEQSSIKQLSKVASNLIKAIKTGDGKIIDNAFDDLRSTYSYYFMVK